MGTGEPIGRAAVVTFSHFVQNHCVAIAGYAKIKEKKEKSWYSNIKNPKALFFCKCCSLNFIFTAPSGFPFFPLISPAIISFETF